ncbi:uncharacterized protein LOC119513112 isoform X2 [Choloepus didactylus]|uniref:uncharacterized protein LOC119513112 isoform X2 n=1 Tax=Choloepus didactylus TaxID=27675 RepID=UPI0018A00C88|nr:uncharacterized protein LOC119513112 isoform X2 [Choloepus didactylus]
MNTAVTDSLPSEASTTLHCFLLIPDDSKGTVAYIPSPKWRKEKLFLRLRKTSGPALLSQYAGAGQEGGASKHQTNASAAARWGVPSYRGCAGAWPPAVTAVARGERQSRGACAGGFAGARGKFAPSARQPGRRRRRRREAEPWDHPPQHPSPSHLTYYNLA